MARNKFSNTNVAYPDEEEEEDDYSDDDFEKVDQTQDRSLAIIHENTNESREHDITIPDVAEEIEVSGSKD